MSVLSEEILAAMKEQLEQLPPQEKYTDEEITYLSQNWQDTSYYTEPWAVMCEYREIDDLGFNSTEEEDSYSLYRAANLMKTPLTETERMFCVAMMLEQTTFKYYGHLKDAWIKVFPKETELPAAIAWRWALGQGSIS